jgi:hypothetical protein
MRGEGTTEPLHHVGSVRHSIVRGSVKQNYQFVKRGHGGANVNRHGYP